MPLAPIINIREFINNVEVLCQMSKTGCYTATIKHNAYLCGMSRNNRFLFKTLEISRTHNNCGLADIYQYQLLKLHDQTTNFQCFCTVFRRWSMSQWWASLFNRVQWSNKKKMECGIMHSKVLQGLLHSLFLDICFLIIVKVHLPHIQKMFLNRQATEISNSMHADCVSKELFKQKD